jgi:alanyl-tRNA synthetase
MPRCNVHTDFFDESCEACRQEYMEMKGAGEHVEEEKEKEEKKYKEFTEERAKKLLEEVMLQYVKSGSTDLEAVEKAKAVVRKQCAIRGIKYWPWL